MATSKSTVVIIIAFALAAGSGITSVEGVDASWAAEGAATLTLMWDPPADETPYSYVIEAGSRPGRADVAVFDTGSPNPVLHLAAVPEGTYYVRVRARGPGGLSAASNEIVVQVGHGVSVTDGTCMVPPPPTGLASTVRGSIVSLRWRASAGATSYQLEAGSIPGGIDVYDGDVADVNALQAAIAPGTYFVRLRARNGCGTSIPSSELTIRVR